MAYFASILPQKTLIEVYKAVILKIEKGLYHWSKGIVEKTESMLYRAVSKSKSQRSETQFRSDSSTDKFMPEKNRDKNRKEPGIQTKTGDKVVYCAEFNKNKCEKESHHEGKFMGKDFMKMHICRQCLSVDKEKQFHSEKDDKCPHKST